MLQSQAEPAQVGPRRGRARGDRHAARGSERKGRRPAAAL